ncbi:hypothetical protein [Loktanella sp. SALINAS62]|uniref:hypothetical protein n=1 Tax=Loktanella sp. SALINAS62 TaxID=2706124 RepID=UPI001B8B88F8|nr:hypothetical protein [Loktanella sp. SALINAS62]MBS1303427.1 hypothetical protein [Loktanella sp. SALINAS62]
MTANFLQVAPDPRFDVVLMNSPFYGQHYKRTGGRLVCILPASAYFDHGNTVGEWHDLPVGSFAESGTNIPTGFCVKHVPG